MDRRRDVVLLIVGERLESAFEREIAAVYDCIAWGGWYFWKKAFACLGIREGMYGWESYFTIGLLAICVRALHGGFDAILTVSTNV